MAKLHHSELKDLQGTRYSAAKARKASRLLARGILPTLPNGRKMSGVDITYLACWRTTRPLPKPTKTRIRA